MFVGSLITRCKPHCYEKFSIALHSILIKSFLHQLLDFALKLLRRTIEKGLFCTAHSRFSSRFSLKDSNDLAIDLEAFIMQWGCKVYHLPLAQTSHTCLNMWYWCFVKANNSCSIYKQLHALYLTDDLKALNYILEFPNCYHQVKYLNQDTYPINKLNQTHELSYAL